MDGAGGYLILFGLIAWGVIYVAMKIDATKKDEELQRTNPELWHKKELLKLEKERMETEKQLAVQRAKQESLSRKVGIGIALGRLFWGK